MNREDIIRMAREAGFERVYLAEEAALSLLLPLERFAAKVAAEEREACAQWAEGWTYLPEDSFTKAQVAENICNTIAYYIRARK
jgi:hypothetical protein